MGAPYETVTVVGYNDNPPPDDGTESEENRVLWETIKEKLPDPLKTALEAIDTNLLLAFAKVVGGAGVISSGVNATVGASDQGKLYRATAAGITITTPDATSVTSPFVFGFLNSSSGAVTLDGNGAQTINGSANVSIPTGAGCILWTDGANWFAVGLGGVLAGNQLGPGAIINGTIAESNATNAVTFAVKTLAGADPSTTDPVLICFRSPTAATGTYVYRTITAATSLVISSGSTLGAVSGTAFDVWLVFFDDAGTVRLGAIQPVLTGTAPYDLGQIPPIASSTAEGGAGAADTAKTFYTGTAVSSKAYAIFAVAKYNSGLVTAGTWNASPTVLQLFGPGVTPPAVPDAALAQPGAMKLLQTVTASSSATVELDTTIDATYDQYIITVERAMPATDDVELNVRFKIGGSYLAGASDYWWNNYILLNATSAIATDVADNQISTTAIAAGSGVGNATGECIDLELRLSRPALTTGFHHITFQGSYERATDGALTLTLGNGRYNSVGSAVTGVQFLFVSGNIASGIFRLYGMKRSIP